VEADLRNLMFGDYMNPDLDSDDRVYEEVTSIEAMYQVAEQCLVEYNNQSKTRMNLVIFGSVEYACHVTSITHITQCSKGCSVANEDALYIDQLQWISMHRKHK